MEEVYKGNASPVRLAFRTGYSGERFSGSQMQPGKRTVEGEFAAACIRMDLFTSHRDGRFQAAGRTDRGVHARGQVFSFSTRFPERALAALNRQLPEDIWVTGYSVVDSSFNPRRHAISRTYRYYFFEQVLDVAAMDCASRLFVGTHDFSLFARAQGKDPVRTVLSSRVFMDGSFPVFEVVAESFLWHMVRYMAAALSRIGTWADGMDLLSSRLGGDTSARLSPASPEGLVLWDIGYPFSFLPLPADARSRKFLADRMLYHRGMTQVYRTIGRSEKGEPGLSSPRLDPSGQDRAS